jgi:hypothetical protein
MAEQYIIVWRRASAHGGNLISAYHSYAAHEALHEARKIVDRVAELLRIEVAAVHAGANRQQHDCQPSEACLQGHATHSPSTAHPVATPPQNDCCP